jgi:hypothetical protein
MGTFQTMKVAGFFFNSGLVPGEQVYFISWLHSHGLIACP